MSSPLNDRLSASQNAEADVLLLQRALGRESVTGNEANFAALLIDEMTDIGLDPGRGDFLPGRPNVWGQKTGSGDGPTLMFVGHTDTVHVRGWAEKWAGTEREDPFAAPVIDGKIWGRGACDLKGGICAALAAVRLLNEAGIQLKGSVSFAFIGDEESGEPGTGVSSGAADLVRRVKAGQIATPDFAVYVEPTRLDVYTAQIGFFIAEITVAGKSAYFGTPEKGVDALKATHQVLSAIWRHEEDLAAGPKHDLVGASNILVTDINGGGYIAVPGECRLSLIRKLRPGEDLEDTARAFEDAVNCSDLQDGITVNITYPAGRDHSLGGSPVEIDSDHPDAVALGTCVQEAFGRRGEIGGAPYWSENPFLVDQIGCPAVYCAPGDISVAHTFEECISVEEYLAAIRAFALFMVRYCGTID
ncbi:M20/M25/M40 family metallo-hydrolase [uncultured Ruegeria sp.]|uniref:M20 family metallopeptidase n=1 Tax=uncultured Ruegeria sp. TaxID=259304 RepID=UPI002625D606|nr:M20/M25/M40 family metallo-hydrolase [uncultured Ruegeria sp.]